MFIDSVVKQDVRERLIKASPKSAYEALIIKLERLLKEASKSIYANLLQLAIDALKTGDDVRGVLKVIERYVANLPNEARLAITKDVYAVSRELYMAGFNLVKLENQGLNIAFNLKDIDAINAIGRHNIFWIGEHFEDVGNELNALIRELYERNYSRQELAERLNERLRFRFKDDERYFEGLAEHIATKTKELGRLSVYERAGIKYVKVKAILDSRTSQICRQMHGRIISVERLAKQRDAILSAKSPDELKAAQRWIPSFTGRTADLPDGVAGPPYHYRCRTTTVAYFEELSGEPVGEETYQYFDGSKTRKERVLFKYFDKELGRELVLTEGTIGHILSARHNIKDIDKVKASIRGIKRWGVSTHPQSAGQMVALSENGVYIVFRDNVVYNMFIDDRGKKATERYFKRWTEGRLQKWVGLLRQFFMGHLTR